MAKDKDRDLIDKMNSALTEDIHDILQKVLAIQLKPILENLKAINHRFDTLEKRVVAVEKEQKKQGKAIKKLQETIDVMIRAFNREDVQLRKRVDRIEEHLGLPRVQ